MKKNSSGIGPRSTLPKAYSTGVAGRLRIEWFVRSVCPATNLSVRHRLDATTRKQGGPCFHCRFHCCWRSSSAGCPSAWACAWSMPWGCCSNVGRPCSCRWSVAVCSACCSHRSTPCLASVSRCSSLKLVICHWSVAVCCSASPRCSTTDAASAPSPSSPAATSTRSSPSSVGCWASCCGIT
ncbi:hypothetical protein D3C87_959950 [compost metagenome]